MCGRMPTTTTTTASPRADDRAGLGRLGFRWELSALGELVTFTDTNDKLSGALVGFYDAMCTCWIVHQHLGV